MVLSTSRDAGSVKHGPTRSSFVRLRPDVVRRIQGSLTLEEFADAVGLRDMSSVRGPLHGKPVRKVTARKIAAFGRVPYEELIDDEKANGLELPTHAEIAKTIPPVARGKVLSREEIEGLAERCGLFTPTTQNPHLAYRTGDISYWDEQRDVAKQALLLWAEFLARSLALNSAESEGRLFATQGDLSHAAAPLVRTLLGRAGEFWPV